MLPRPLMVLVLALPVMQCYGSSPVATISSTQPVLIGGIAVPTNRVMSWPVAVNDEIATQTAPATLRFTDGTVVTLQRNSRMRLEPNSSGVGVKMLSGSASYALKPNSTVSVESSLAGARIPTGAQMAAAPRQMSRNEAAASAMAYRMPASAPAEGMVFAPTMVSTAVFPPSVSPHGPQSIPPRDVVILPSGLVLFVTPNTVQGAITGYTVVGVGAETANGIISTPGVTTLNGYTIVVVNGPVTSDQIRLFAPGSPVPLPDNQAATLVQNTVTTVNQTLPSGQQISTTPGITIQPFSKSAP